MIRNISAALAVLFATTAYAETNPLQFDLATPNACSLGEDGTVTLQTYAMPKGWFSSKNTFDRAKTEIRVSQTLSATSCTQGAGEATLSSKTLGTFQPDYIAKLNPTSKEIGYFWNMVGDLSAAQNHWWYYTGCDGVAVVVGCPETREVTFTVKAYGQDGQCRTYTDAYGTVSCAGDTIGFTLASVQDPSQFVDAATCGGSVPACGIGQCVSERVQNGGYCDTQFPENLQLDPNQPKPTKNNPNPAPRYYDANEKLRSDCKTDSECFCKAKLDPACNANLKNCE